MQKRFFFESTPLGAAIVWRQNAAKLYRASFLLFNCCIHLDYNLNQNCKERKIPSLNPFYINLKVGWYPSYWKWTTIYLFKKKNVFDANFRVKERSQQGCSQYRNLEEIRLCKIIISPAGESSTKYTPLLPYFFFKIKVGIRCQNLNM